MIEPWNIRNGSEESVDSPEAPAHTLLDDINKISVKWQLTLKLKPLDVDRKRVTTKYTESHHTT